MFGFDTAVIAGTTQQLTSVYHLTAFTLGLTVFIGLAGTVIGAMTRRGTGQRIGGREALRIMAVLYTVSALGCALRLELAGADGFPVDRGSRASAALPCSGLSTSRNWRRPSGGAEW